MNIRKITFGNFKSLYNAAFEPGKVNVFIGANGSGKTTILEAIGLLSAAMTDRAKACALVFPHFTNPVSRILRDNDP